MNAKSKSVARGMRVAKIKSFKKTAAARSSPASGVKGMAKAKRYRMTTHATPPGKARTSLVGATIYPASVEPSKRAKQVIAALADPSVAA